MNCFLHVPLCDLPDVLAAMHRVLKPGGLLYWGQYGGVEHQGPLESDHYEPKRFFSMLTDDALRTAGEAQFQSVEVETLEVSRDWEQHFQSSTWRRTPWLRMLNRIPLTAVLLALLCGACTPEARPTNTIPPESRFYAALTGVGRSTEDRARDSARRPAEILELAGIAEGMVIVDLMAGGGWYTEVLARAVGSTGRVIAQNSEISDERYGALLRERLATSQLTNVELVVQELDSLSLAPASLDAVFMVQFYHDTYWMGVERAAMNRAVFNALKPGGVYLVIDHSAEVGSLARDVDTLHRVDEAMVRDEILAAGFSLDADSDLLRNEADSRRASVFKPSIRGRSDRFVLKFAKPSP